jgi:hypothetical protein
MRMSMLVAGVGLLLVAGCGAGSSRSSDPAATGGNAAICGRALGIVALSEVGDDLDRQARESADAAKALHELATQTQDRSLADALGAAANTAEQGTRERLSPDRLTAWAAQERARFDAIRKACF